MKTTLTFAFLALLLAPRAHAARCDIKGAIETEIRQLLSKEQVGLTSIDKITHQSGNQYFVEYSYTGADQSGSYDDSGAAVLEVDEVACVAKPLKKR